MNDKELKKFAARIAAQLFIMYEELSDAWAESTDEDGSLFTAGAQAHLYGRVTAPAGRSYIDQSKSEYNITLPGGVAPGHELDRQLRDTLEQIEREKRARQRASMSHD